MKKSIGLDIKPPEKTCNDLKCPWHGTLPVRGKTISGVVMSSKPNKTAIVEWHYTKLIPKYERYERKKIRISAHNPDCIKAREGENVLLAECRPLSKTKSFVVVSR